MSEKNGGLEPNREIETTNAMINNRKLGVMASMLRALPTLFVLAALGGLAAYGHFNGWRIPKTSSLFSDVDAEAEWCEEHGVPEAECAEAEGCCSPLCDLGEPNECPGTGQTCQPVFDPQPMGYENIGVCTSAL